MQKPVWVFFLCLAAPVWFWGAGPNDELLPEPDTSTVRAEPTHAAPAGVTKEPRTRLLESGAALLQSNVPPRQLRLVLDGFLVDKEHANLQTEAHRYCRQVNEDFAQCAIFDGAGKDANLVGVEYVISERLFQQLPDGEKKYWHPNNYEILSGQLRAPGLPEVAEHALMKAKINSYGKAWTLWNTGHFNLGDGSKLPLGEPALQWSFNHDGEADPGLDLARQRRDHLASDEIRRNQRADLVPLAHPQEGVDAMKGQFKGALESIPGVQDAGGAK